VAFLLDTSILSRLANHADREYPSADWSVLELHRRGELLHLTPQNLIEFRNMATRPTAANGLGLSAAEASSKAADFETTFRMLPDTPDIYPAWKTLVDALGVVGKQVHDARLVAVCHVHRMTHLLTFNVGHFARLASFGPGLAVVHPATV
jgi:predicted nucleic acid-binding protein